MPKEGVIGLLSRTAKHALNVLRCLVRDGDRRMTVAELAQETGIPPNYLSKVLNQLRKQEVVEGEKGWGGGFRLRPGAIDRPIRDVVQIFDGPSGARREECIFGLRRCDSANPCALHGDWEKTRHAADDLLNHRRIRDLVSLQ